MGQSWTLPLSDLPPVIGLCGYAGAGKTTAASVLVRNHGYTRLRYAAPIKAAVAAIIAAGSGDSGYARRCVDGDLKERPCAELGGATPRVAMQTLGTEWGRRYLGELAWLNIMQMRAGALLAEGRRIVIDDVRFDDEARQVKRLGGPVLLVQRADVVRRSAHKSEDLPPYDAVIRNDGDESDLARSIGRMFSEGAL